jgi:hypothetical protein
MTANDSWITQGRQDHGRFGNGTAGGTPAGGSGHFNATVGKPTWARRYGWAVARRAAMQATNRNSMKTADMAGPNSGHDGQVELAAAPGSGSAPDTAASTGWFARNWQGLRDTVSEAYDEVSKMTLLEALANLADASQGIGDPAGHDIAMALRGLERFAILGTIATNFAAGTSFERTVLEALPASKNTILLSNRFRTIPDIIDPVAKTITEVKSGAYIAGTPQISRQALGSLERGWKYNLIVGMSTEVSQPVIRYIELTGAVSVKAVAARIS